MTSEYVEGRDYDFMELLKQCAYDSVMECPICGTRLEPDAEKCYECGFDDRPRNRGMI